MGLRTSTPVGPSLLSAQRTTAASASRSSKSGVAASNMNMKPVCVKPTAHDIATGRDPTRVKVFDTTLRDGEQSPGCSMTSEEKMQVQFRGTGFGV